MKSKLVLIGCCLTLTVVAQVASAQAPANVPEHAPARIHPLPTLREQAKERQAWLEMRMERILPALMAEYDVRMWILSMREYAEDPVFWSITSPTTFAARRRSIYVITRRDDGSLERLALGGTSQGGVFEAFRSTRPAPTQPTAELVGSEQWNLPGARGAERGRASSAPTSGRVGGLGGGVGGGGAEGLREARGDEYARRVKREPRLAMNYIGLRLPEMMPRYRKIEETVHAIISEAFSNSVITPGVTTTEDVVWWMRQKLRDLGYTTWFQTSVDVQRRGEIARGGPVVIQKGDLLWTDYGVVGLNLHTDTQHLGYALKDGETSVPPGLQQCLATPHPPPHILLRTLEPAPPANPIPPPALGQMRSEGIDGTVYTHPIGDHGHGAGPLIGRWDGQEGVPVRGDAVLLPSTWHSIELQATTPIPEWGGKPASCRQEEEAYLDEQGERHWVFRRQNRFHLVW